MAKDSVHKWAKKLEVPIDLMLEVSEFIVDRELPHRMTAVNLVDEIITIEVYYDRDELDDVNELAELVDGSDDDGNEE